VNEENGELAELAIQYLLKDKGTSVIYGDYVGKPDIVFTSDKRSVGFEVKSLEPLRRSKRKLNKYETGNIRIEFSEWDSQEDYCKENNLEHVVVVEIRFRHPIGRQYFVLPSDFIKERRLSTKGMKTFSVSFWQIYKKGIALEEFI